MKHSLSIFIPFIAFIAGFVAVSCFIYDKSIKTPSLLGHSLAYALRQATVCGFNLKILSEKESIDIKPGTVIAQKPAPGSIIKQKQVVFVTLAKAPELSTIPQFVGLAERQWQKIVGESFFVKSYTIKHTQPFGVVIAQTPQAGTETDNQTVHLLVSAGQETVRLMPKVIGQDSAVVKEFLENYGITVSFFKEQYRPDKHADYTPGTIIAQKPLAGSWIDLKKPLVVQLVVLYD